MPPRTRHLPNRHAGCLPRRRRPALRAATLLLAASVVPGAEAAPVAVVNPGFEDISGEAPFNEFTFGPLNGWDLYDPNVPQITDGGDGPTYYIGTLQPQPDPGNPGSFINFPGGAPEGTRVGIAFNFFGSGGAGEYGFVQEITSAQLQPFTEYTLEVEIGNIASGFAQSGQFFTLDGFPGYRVDLMAGNEILAQDLNSLDGLIPEGEFATSTVSFISGAAHVAMGENLFIRLVNLNQVDPAFPGSDLEVDFDNVRLDAVVVPLPPMAPACALAAAGLLLVRRRA